MNAKAKKLWDFMADSHLPEEELMRRMKIASAWIDLWPEVFRHGKPTHKWTRTHRKPSNGQRQWKETLYLTNGRGETRKYRGEDVPSSVPRPWLKETDE
tara:strand:- start:2362 stop:2658 length:297 start_codon:yes stop_codon:yes gene_type:complete